jgi:hypothetical protein
MMVTFVHDHMHQRAREKEKERQIADNVRSVAGENQRGSDYAYEHP